MDHRITGQQDPSDLGRDGPGIGRRGSPQPHCPGMAPTPTGKHEAPAQGVCGKSMEQEGELHFTDEQTGSEALIQGHAVRK